MFLLLNHIKQKQLLILYETTYMVLILNFIVYLFSSYYKINGT